MGRTQCALALTLSVLRCQMIFLLIWSEKFFTLQQRQRQTEYARASVFVCTYC